MPEKEFHEKSDQFRKQESILDGVCKYERRTGVFDRYSMEKTKLIRYAGEKGKTRIVIEYDSDTGKGWLRAVNEYPEDMTIRRGHLDSH